MITCPFCQAEQVPNSIYCSECGQFLLDDDKRKTEHYDSREIEQSVKSSGIPEKELSFALKAGKIILQLNIGAEKRAFDIPLNKTILFGRTDPALQVFPEVDLTYDLPEAKSVSRRHATITIQNDRIVVQDLGSVNGSFVNGNRLDPYVPQVLCDGDLLQLGKLPVTIKFKTVS